MDGLGLGEGGRGGRNQAVLDRDGNDLCGRFDPGMVETKIDGANANLQKRSNKKPNDTKIQNIKIYRCIYICR